MLRPAALNLQFIHDPGEEDIAVGVRHEVAEGAVEDEVLLDDGVLRGAGRARAIVCDV